MISLYTAKERVDYMDQHGIDAAIEQFSVTRSSLERYERLIRDSLRPAPQKLPNILVFDVETSPMAVFVWGLYKQRINHNNVIQDWHLISWAAKWLMSGEVMSDVLTPTEARKHDDSRIVKKIWNLLETANLVIAHNGKAFDLRKLNARFMLNGLKPPSPYQVIDTLVESRKMAAHSSHRLDYLGQIMYNKNKLDTDFELWKKCYVGDQESLDYMVKYNKIDVELLEEVYLFMRGWIKSHPNVGLYMDIESPVCSNCGSEKLHPIESYSTTVGQYDTFRCGDCGGICRMRTTNVPIKKRKSLTVSVAR